MSGLDGISVAAVTDWLEQRAGIVPPLDFDVVTGGHSNLTYLVTDADGRRLVLRRPPMHGVLESAHDMQREHRIITALEPTAVPVPSCVGFEPDPAVTGAPFYVMSHVDGAVIRDEAAAERTLTRAARRAAAYDLVDVLVSLHAIEPGDIGLGDLGRRDGYIARQLRRWRAQLDRSATQEQPLLDAVHTRLAAGIPVQGPAAIVHGDYRLDNLILDPQTGAVRAVLDWELATLGDPLADVGLLAVYWSGADEAVAFLGQPTRAGGFPDAAAVVERYAQRSGRDVSDLDFYLAFGYWKLACILEGVRTRVRGGAYGQAREDVDPFGQAVDALAQRSADAVNRAGR